LQQQSITENEITGFENKIKIKIQKVLDFAEQETREPLEQSAKFIYTEI
jgi:pyruvate dehydrogenase E1 component alpha subunit